ncbi:MAG: class II aldolase/adducin family protein [Pseudomonadota bacterium]
MAEASARRDLAAAHRLAVRDGLNEGTWNHMSLESPDDPALTLITPGYTHWRQVSASTLALMSPEGEMVAGSRPPIRAGWIIHGPVQKARPDAKCLMHVHAPNIVALSMGREGRLDTCGSQLAAQFHDDIAYFEVYDGVLREEDEGARMADALGDKRVLILANHGCLVAGPNVARAYLDLYQLERACLFQLLATAGGRELRGIPEGIAAEMGAMSREGHSDRHFEAMTRLLDEDEPDYAQ